MTDERPLSLSPILLAAKMKAEFELAHSPATHATPARIILELRDGTPPRPGTYLVQERVDGYEPRWNVETWDGRLWSCGGYVGVIRWAELGPI